MEEIRIETPHGHVYFDGDNEWTFPGTYRQLLPVVQHMARRIVELEAQNAAPLLPELDKEMRAILGRPNFTCIRLANSLRQLGQQIPSKAEEEQASVIYWMLSLYLQHGKAWKQQAEIALNKLEA